MRIGIDARPLIGKKAGIGDYVEGLIIGLNQIDNENHYLLIGDQELPKLEINSNFQVKIIPKSPFWHLQVANFILTNDLIYHATHSLLDAVLVKKRAVLTINDLTGIKTGNLHTFKVKAINKLFFKRAVRSVSQIITPTEVVKKELVEVLPEAKEKTAVIYDAVKDDFGSKADKNHLAKYDLKPGYIFFNATLEPRKNVVGLLQAYSDLETDQPLVLAGKKGWGYLEIEKKIRDLKLDSRVKVLDWVGENELESLYQFAGIFVYPSLSEGFGLSPLKAFKTGVPVLVSNLTVFEEVVGEAALKVEPTDSGGLTEGMRRLLTDEKLRHDYRQKGFERLEKYSWQKTAEQTRKIYHKIDDETH